jgi:ribose transport system substrate-binding protein
VLGLLIIAAIAIYLFMIREQDTPPIKLALVTWTQDPFWEPVIRGAQDCATASNIDLTIVQAKPTVDDQNQHIKELLGTGIVGIAISPNDAAAQAAILNDAAAKMPVVTFDTDAPDSKRKRFVGIDNYAAGHMAADELREALPDGGAVLITVGSATMQHGRDRRQGVIDGLIERGFDRARAADALDATLKGSKYTIVATVEDGADPSKATADIAAALKAHPEVKGIIGLFSYSAPAALEAMKQTGMAGQVKVVGFDDSDETQAALVAGTIHSSVLQDTYRAGYEAVRVLADEARGVARGPAEQSPIVNVRINVLTADNLNEMRDSGSIRTPGTSATPVPTKPAG